MGKRKRFTAALESLVVHVSDIDWWETFGTPRTEGACIPVAVFTAEFLTVRGFPSRPMEAELMADDPRDAGYMEVVSPNDEWTGHLVSWTPSRLTFVDASLQTQDSRILRNIEAPTILEGKWNHREGSNQWANKVGKGAIGYRFHPDREDWKKRSWPWEWIREVAHEAATEWSE